MASDTETDWVRARLARALGDDLSESGVAETDAGAIWHLLTPAERAGLSPLPDPLPAAPPLLHRLAPRIDALPDAHRLALLIASVSIVERTDLLAAASGLTLDDLVDGTLDGLLTFVARRYRVSDPRVRIVAHAAATVGERTHAHTRLAAALAGSFPHEAAWHQSLAALGGRPDVVPRLLGLSRRALRHGDSDFAYRVAREAASQAEPGRLRSLAQLRAGLSALHTGHTREAREWLGGVLRSGDVTLEASALAAFVFAVGAADGHVPHADLDRLEGRWTADLNRGRTPGSGRGIVLGLATAAALHAERGDAQAAQGFVARAHAVMRHLGAVDAASAASAHDIVAGVGVWLEACGAAEQERPRDAAPFAAHGVSSDPTVAAGIALIDAFAALRDRGAAGARDASHSLADSILSLAPLDGEAGVHGGVRGSATPLVEAHLRVAHWIVEHAGREGTVATSAPGAPSRRGPVLDPSDPRLAPLPLHLPFGGAFVREAGALSEAHPSAASATATWMHAPVPLGVPAVPGLPGFSGRPDLPHLPDDEPAWLAALTAREAEVARLVVGGASNREVAALMHLSVRTVEVHLGRVFQKLEVHSRTQLSVLVHRGGYVETRS